MELITLPSNIIFSSHLAQDLDRVLAAKPYSRIVVLVDSNTHKACYPKLQFLKAHDIIEIEPGEAAKNLDTCAKVWSELTRLKIDRKGLLIVLGGGVAGDLGGFCACTYKRGIDFILLPTTLLSQVDASVGGKLGIDFEGYKNHIGVFQEPTATLIHTNFLETLPQDELRSGFAEVTKHCLLSDKKKWDEIKTKTLEAQDWGDLTRHSVKFKAGVVRVDPREKGLRKVLNFGHTVGHALESYFLSTSKRLLHGEAIAIGMVAESWIAFQRKILSIQELVEITDYVIGIFGTVELPKDKSTIIQIALQDKKNVGDKILIAVPKGIGECVWDVEITEREILDSLSFYEGIGEK
jgi:3-dehydroquinate synthase